MADKELSAENFKGEEKFVDISTLVRDKSFQPRADMDLYKKMVVDVAESVKNGVKIDPVYVVELTEDGKTFEGKKLSKGDRILVDGFRRCDGHLAADRSKIPAIVREGTVQDAYDVASSANISNLAIPRTREDKVRAVEMSLFNHFEFSDNWHSKHCMVGHELPSKLRPKVEKLLPKEVVEKAKVERKTASGKTQAAKKKRKPKPEGAASKKLVDWADWEDHFRKMQKFIDHVGELEGKTPDFNKAHGTLEKHGEAVLAWKEKIKEAAKKAQEKAQADAKAEAKAKSDAKAEAKKEEAAKNGKATAETAA